MTQDSAPRKREWQEIAAEASVEMDKAKLHELAKELERALDEREQAEKRPAA
jgi:hypothetical protein